MLRFRTDITKKIQAAGVLLRLEKGRMDRVRLLKLLYIADREALKESGKPIVGGRAVAMEHGPLHSEVYDLIKGEHAKEQLWSEFFESEGHSVTLKKDPGRLDLSPYEIEKLTEVSSRYATVDSWEVAEITHGFAEWRKCYRENTSTTIPLESILESLGFSPEEVADLKEDAETHKQLLNAFGA